MRRYVLALLHALFAVAVTAQDTKDKPSDYQLQMRVRIPMRDGVHLNATLYRPVPASPATANPPLPVIFVLSPYPAANSHPSGS